MVAQYRLVLTKAAQKDKDKIRGRVVLQKNVNHLLMLLRDNPYQTPPSYEKLSGKYKDLYSRRINHQHRLVYKVDDIKKVVIIISMWTHYEF